MRIPFLILQFFIVLQLIFSCKERKVKEKNDYIQKKQIVQEKNTFFIKNFVEDSKFTDSIKFFQLIKEIINTSEKRSENREYVYYGYLSSKVYKMVYETTEQEVSIERKLELLILLDFHHRLTTNDYRAQIMGLVNDKNSLVLKNNVLLLPIMNSENITDNFLKYLKNIDTILVPKNYHECAFNTLKLIHLSESQATLNTGLNPFFKKLYSKEFLRKYSTINQRMI